MTSARPVRLRRVATVLGAVPLAVGVAVYAAWRVTRWDALVHWGLMTLAAGAVAFVVGMGFLVAHVVGRGGQRVTWDAAVREALAPAAFLVGVAAVGLGLAASAVHLMTSTVVRVENGGTETVDRVEVSGGGAAHVWTGLAPGAAESATLDVRQDGALTYRVVVGDDEADGVAIAYVTPGMGAQATIRVGDGAVRVER